MKKICFVVTSPFAANAFLLELIKELSLKYHITLCLNLSLYPLLPDFDDCGVQIINIPIERKPSLLLDLKCFWNLITFFKYEQFSAIHTLTPKAGFIGMLSAYLCSVPIRIHVFTGQTWIHEKKIKRWFYKYIDRVTVFFSSQIFCDSNSQSIFLQNENIIKKDKISVIGKSSISGVNLARFNSQAGLKLTNHFPQLESQNHFIFLFVGRITQKKGIFDLIEAFVQVHKNDLRARLWIVGPDEEDLKAKILFKFQNPNGVIWLGPLKNPEVLMAKADVLVLPSHGEGFGMVIVEAAACKTPAIAYRINGVVDAIEDGRSGILVDKSDVKKLELAMKTMMLNPNLVTQMGEYAYQRAVDLFCSKKIINKWLSIYESILSE